MSRFELHPTLPPTVDEALNHLPPLTRTLLWNRGIDSRAAADAFLSPSWDADLHDPFLLPDMRWAVERTLRAIKNGERVALWTDYDCDGIPAGALLHDFFKKIGHLNFENYIPHRHSEGYGLNEKGIDVLHSRGATLLITADVGITDHAPIAHAKSLGMDVIVTDHHLPTDTLPPADAVINVKRRDSTYPFDGLCGAATAWKLVHALMREGDFDVSAGWEKWLLDLVGIATVADMMPLRGENRLLAHFGLVVLRKTPRPGIRALLKLLRIPQGALTEDDIGFSIAPRINAASRMDHPEDAFRLLTAESEGQALEYAKHLDHLNDMRKGVVASTVKEVKKRLEDLPEREVIVLGNPSWRPALLGLVANSLVETYERPVFLWGREGGETLKGSCRSDGTVSVVELMTASKDVLVEFGGHLASGGFSIMPEKAHLLENALVEAYQKLRESESRPREEKLDAALSLEEVTLETYRLFEKLAPFGEGNAKPLFIFRDALVAALRSFGRDNQHLELQLERFDGSRTPAIAFFTDPTRLTRAPAVGQRVNIVGHIEYSSFGGRRTLRIRLVDVV